MSPMEDDPNVWQAMHRALQPVKESLAYVAPFLAPALVGGVLGAMKKDARSKGWGYWLNTVGWSTVAGAFLAPLFAHFAGIDPMLGGSVACLIGMMGRDTVDFFRDKLRMKKTDAAAPDPDKDGE